MQSQISHRRTSAIASLALAAGLTLAACGDAEPIAPSPSADPTPSVEPTPNPTPMPTPDPAIPSPSEPATTPAPSPIPNEELYGPGPEVLVTWPEEWAEITDTIRGYDGGHSVVEAWGDESTGANGILSVYVQPDVGVDEYRDTIVAQGVPSEDIEPLPDRDFGAVDSIGYRTDHVLSPAGNEIAQWGYAMEMHNGDLAEVVLTVPAEMLADYEPMFNEIFDSISVY